MVGIIVVINLLVNWFTYNILNKFLCLANSSLFTQTTKMEIRTKTNAVFEQALIFEEKHNELIQSKCLKKRAKLRIDMKHHYPKYVHIIEPNIQQIYTVKNLHITSHYTIHSKNIKALSNVYKQNKYTAVKLYESDKSYVSTSVVIINGSTKEWSTQIDLLYTSINFDTMYELVLQNGTFDKNRMNHQISVGFTNLSYTKYSITDIPKPKLLRLSHNKDLIKVMDIVTSLCDTLYQHGYFNIMPFYEKYRNENFGNTISPKNRLEGMTVVWYAGNSHLLKAHLDKNNCSNEGFNIVMGISKLIKGGRLVILGYAKKVCSDYILRFQR